jgi:hypothetical protein
VRFGMVCRALSTSNSYLTECMVLQFFKTISCLFLTIII